MKPLPAVMLLPKPEPWAIEKNAPARPQSSPVMITAAHGEGKPGGAQRWGDGSKSPDAPLGNACDSVCPMRLQPRNIKRRMFSCVQCGQCLDACDSTHTAQGRSPTLQWRIGEDALRETLRQRREHPPEQR